MSFAAKFSIHFKISKCYINPFSEAFFHYEWLYFMLKDVIILWLQTNGGYLQGYKDSDSRNAFTSHVYILLRQNKQYRRPLLQTILKQFDDQVTTKLHLLCKNSNHSVNSSYFHRTMILGAFQRKFHNLEWNFMTVHFNHLLIRFFSNILINNLGPS